jgi:hypothetical protein
VRERPGHQLAQINVARLLAPLDSPQSADFVAALAPVNALADASAGFVWRFQTDEGDATAVHPGGDPLLIVNLSVWAGLEQLRSFAFGGVHVGVLRRRRAWFEKPAEEPTALWWVPAGDRPAVTQAMARLAFLRTHGPTPTAFTFRSPFPAPD